MTRTPEQDRIYIRGVFDQLRAAHVAGDTAATIAILTALGTDGYEDVLLEVIAYIINHQPELANELFGDDPTA